MKTRLTILTVLGLPMLGISCNIRDPRMEVLGGAGGIAGHAGTPSDGTGGTPGGGAGDAGSRQ